MEFDWYVGIQAVLACVVLVLLNTIRFYNVCLITTADEDVIDEVD